MHINIEITIYLCFDENFYLSNSSRPFAFLNAFRPLQREVLQRQTRARIILTTWLLQLSSFNAGAWLHDLVITKNWKVRWTLIKSYKRKNASFLRCFDFMSSKLTGIMSKFWLCFEAAYVWVVRTFFNFFVQVLWVFRLAIFTLVATQCKRS